MSDGTKDFSIQDVIGTITGRLLGEMGGIYAVCEFMCGFPVWTHQLPRVCQEVRPAVLLQHPQLAPVIQEADAVTRDNWKQMIDGWSARFGASVQLRPMAAGEVCPQDPIAELAEMAPGVPVVVVSR